MDYSEKAAEYLMRAFGEKTDSISVTDPEFYSFFTNFAFGEVPSDSTLDEKTRHICILAVLLGCGGCDEFERMLSAALACGVTAAEARETVYQAAAYLGIGRVRPFFEKMNKVFCSIGLKLPLEDEGTTTPATRLEEGNKAQIEIFGEGMREFWKNAPADRANINMWLADNCFGDYYTRGALGYRQRELITFCFLYAQGGCEPQLASHIKGNLSVGNDRETLIQVVLQCVPYIGYPRSLNALSAIDSETKD